MTVSDADLKAAHDIGARAAGYSKLLQDAKPPRCPFGNPMLQWAWDVGFRMWNHVREHGA